MAEEQVMSTSDMANEIVKMKNHWRVFERADEVALALQRAEGRKTELDAAIKALEDKQKSADSDFIAATDKLVQKQKVLQEFEASLDKKMADAKAKFESDMEELGKHYSDTSVAARDKVAKDLADEQAKVDELVAKKSDLQRDVRLLQAEIETLEQKKAALL